MPRVISATENEMLLAAFKRLRGKVAGPTESTGWREREAVTNQLLYRRRKKSSLLVPRKKPRIHRGVKKPFSPSKLEDGDASGANMKQGKRGRSRAFSRQFFSSPLITDTSLQFRSNEPYLQKTS